MTTDTQAPLITLLLAGKMPGESGVPEHIETVVSDVFLFQDRVYKLYKNDNDFFNQNFNNLSDRLVRLAFTKSDFKWNQQLAGEVYLQLQGVKMQDEAIELVQDHENPDELLQVTKRLPTGSILFDQLRKGSLSQEDYRSMGRQFEEREKHFELGEAFPDETVLENLLGRYADIDEWIKSVEQYVPVAEREMYMRELKELMEKVYDIPNPSAIAVCFDSHSLNAFYVDGKIYPFDTYSPKAAWRFGPPLLNVYRIAADIFALGGEEAFRAFVDGYIESAGIGAVSRDMDRFLVLYASLIMVPYLYMISQSDTSKLDSAILYHNFLKKYADA